MMGVDLRLAACALTLLGSSLLGTVFRFYYVRVFLERHRLSPRWLNFAQIFFIVANIIIEPFLGFLQDFGCTRVCKRRRRMILFGGLLLVGAFLSPWFSPYDPYKVPAWVPGVHLMFVMFFWNLFFVLALSAYCGLYAEQSTEHSNRVKLYKYEAIARFVGNLVIFPVDKISASLRDFANFQYCCLAVGGAAAICFIITGLTAPDNVAHESLIDEEEPVTTITGIENPMIPQEENLERPIEAIISNSPEIVQYSMQENSFLAAGRVAGQMFRNPDFLSAVASNFCGWMRAQAFWNFLSVHTEILVSSNILSPGSFLIALFYQLCVLVPLLISAFAISPLTSRYGCYWMIQVSNVLTWLNSGLALILVKWTGYNIALALLSGECILLIFQGIFHMILGEVIDQDAKKHKRKLPPSTFVYTLNGMVVRMSIGLAPILVTFLLNLGDYSTYKDDLESAPPNLQLASFMTAAGVPGFFSVLGFLCLLPYKIRRTSAAATRD